MSARLKRLSLPAGLLFTAVVIPTIFRLGFGIVDGYCLTFTAFLLLLQIAIEIIPRKTDELGATAGPAKIAPSGFDFLGAGLAAVPSGGSSTPPPEARAARLRLETEPRSPSFPRLSL